jgi:hypothetical protein
MGPFYPTPYNLCVNGERYIRDFEGITSDPLFGQTPEDYFCLLPGSPAIDAGKFAKEYYNGDFSGNNPDLGALESTENIETWRDMFGHCGPTWITRENAPNKAPNRPEWPVEIDPRWGGLE